MNNKDQVHTTKFPPKVYHTLTVTIILLFSLSPRPYVSTVIHLSGASMIVRCEPGSYAMFSKFASSKMFDIMSLSSTYLFILLVFFAFLILLKD